MPIVRIATRRLNRPSGSARLSGTLLVGFGLALSSAAHAQAPPKPGAEAVAQQDANPQPPSPIDSWRPSFLTATRYDEQWTLYRDPEKRDEHWAGPFKYIPLSDTAWATVGLELRARNEDYGDNDWGSAPAPNNSYAWLRALPYVDVHAETGSLGGRVFVQPMATYAVGVLPKAKGIDQSAVDMLQSFADVRVGPAQTGSTTDYGFTLRYGREMISLGTERLVGSRYGINVPLAFDGVRGLLSLPGAVVTFLSVTPVTPVTHDFDDHPTHGRSLWGAYATMPHVGPTSVDLYYLGYHNALSTLAGVQGNEVRHTIGTRFFHVATAGGWHWNVEGMKQFGDLGASSIDAWAIGSEFGYKVPFPRLAPDFTFRADAISGDRRPGDGQVGTFNPLFPKGKYFGELSPVGPVNLLNVNPRIIVPLTSTVSVGVTGDAYWRYSLEDGVYDATAMLLRAPGASRARFIGKQLEGGVAWRATEYLILTGALSVFDPGDFIRQTGPGKTIKFADVEATFRF